MRIFALSSSLLRSAAYRLLRNRIFVRSVGPAKGLRMRPGPSGAMLLDSVGLGRVLAPTKEQIYLARFSGLEGKTVFDIGGFMGELTMAFAHMVGPEGRVITFEPNPINVEAIHSNLALNQTCRVQVLQVGVGAGPATLDLVFDPSGAATGSLDAEIQRSLGDRPVQRVQVQVDSLDNLMTRHALPNPHMVKVDVEGLEMEVLRGMQGVVERHHPILYIELHGVGVEAKRRNASNVMAWLGQHGYSLYHVEQGRGVHGAGDPTVYSGHLVATHLSAN